MNVSELFDLSKWVMKEIQETKIPQKYQALQTILQQHAKQNQPKLPFEDQQNDLIDALLDVPLGMLTKDQLLFLHKLGILQAVGEEGKKMIEDILYKNVIDVATSAQKLQQIIEELNNGVNKSQQIIKSLEGYTFEEEYETDNEVLIRISFTGLATMSNVTDFKKWGNIWYEIGRGIAMAHNASPEDIKIVGATKGSIIIELAVIALIAKTTSGIILEALKVADKILDIRKKVEEIRNLKLKNKKIAIDIETEAENEKEARIEEISAQFAKKLNLKEDGEGDKIRALFKAVNNLVNFLESGGEVEFIIPEEKVEEDENAETSSIFKELRVTFQKIRQLDNKIKLLESKNT